MFFTFEPFQTDLLASCHSVVSLSFHLVPSFNITKAKERNLKSWHSPDIDIYVTQASFHGRGFELVFYLLTTSRIKLGVGRIEILEIVFHAL